MPSPPRAKFATIGTMAWLRAAALALLAWIALSLWAAPGPKDLAPGVFLIARRDLPDPNFFESVILLVDYSAKGAMGLVINRQTKFPISRVLSSRKEAEGRSDLVYAGGPVGRFGVLALLRAKTAPQEARHVFDDVYLVTTDKLLSEQLAARTPASHLRVFLGYSGWAPRQLDMEMELGTWHVLPADPAAVFDPSPEKVWERLVRRTDLQIASRLRPYTVTTGIVAEP